MQSHTALRHAGSFESCAEQVRVRVPSPGVLLFDLCGVLVDDTIWTRWLLQLVSRLGRRISFEAFAAGWEQYLIDVNAGRCNYWDAVQEYLLSLGLSRGAVDEISVAAKARRKLLDESIRPLPGITTGLGQLARAGFRLAVVGNIPHDERFVRERLQRLGMADLFSHVFSSVDLGRNGTEHRYRAIAERLGAEPQMVWFISSSRLELLAAAAQGLSVLAWQLPEHGDVIHSMEQLHELLRGSTARPQLLAG